MPCVGTDRIHTAEATGSSPVAPTLKALVNDYVELPPHVAKRALDTDWTHGGKLTRRRRDRGAEHEEGLDAATYMRQSS